MLSMLRPGCASLLPQAGTILCLMSPLLQCPDMQQPGPGPHLGLRSGLGLAELAILPAQRLQLHKVGRRGGHLKRDQTLWEPSPAVRLTYSTRFESCCSISELAQMGFLL